MNPDTRATRSAELTAAVLPVASRYRVTDFLAGFATVTLGKGGGTYWLPCPHADKLMAVAITPTASARVLRMVYPFGRSCWLSISPRLRLGKRKSHASRVQ